MEGDSADMCAGKFPLVSMGGRAEGLACADPGARTPIGASEIILRDDSRIMSCKRDKKHYSISSFQGIFLYTFRWSYCREKNEGKLDHSITILH